MALAWPNKDPDEVLDYVVDWSARLDAGDVISTSTWPVSPAGITVDSIAKTDTETTIWLSGGSIGVTYTFVNRIVTTGGRTMDQSVKIKIKVK